MAFPSSLHFIYVEASVTSRVGLCAASPRRFVALRGCGLFAAVPNACGCRLSVGGCRLTVVR